jgi:hypothetical protein
MQKHIALSMIVWTNLAAGFAGSDLESTLNKNFLAGILFRTFDLSENVLAALLLITLCVLHLFRRKKTSTTSIVTASDELPIASSATPTTFANRITIAIIDDDIFIRESWELFLQEFNIVTYDSPESFLLALDRNSSLISSLDAIVVDYDFGAKSTLSGADLAAVLRKKTSSPIILSTDRAQRDIPDFERFDLHLDKNILDWHSLQKLLPAVISQ